MATFMLVHGAWIGSWCWQDVAELLRQQGHKVYTPSLTGIGERSHLLSKDITLETHIQDVCNAIRYEELNDITLCGHSYSGLIIAAVADRLPAQIKKVIYIDAVIPEQNDSMMSIFKNILPNHYQRYYDRVTKLGEGWKLLPTDATKLGITDLALAEKINKKACPQVFQTWQDSVSLQASAYSFKEGAYIYADEKDNVFQYFVQQIKQRTTWNCASIATGHLIMFTEPRKLAELLEKM